MERASVASNFIAPELTLSKGYVVRLSAEEGQAAAAKIKHANLLLNRDVILLCDQLNIPKLASRYEAFAPATARRLVERLAIHHTPNHGSWLNLAENERSALTRQSLARPIPDQESLEREPTAWSIARNQRQKSVDWQFTTADARIRLIRLYPHIEN